MAKQTIANVSDTSLWVAFYRAQESERSDALFQDPLAKVLIGERGKQIAESMKVVGRYTASNVIFRTLIIDQFIQVAIKDGIEAIVNLGAGMDTRPYRMSLPSDLLWIEVDYPQVILHKNKTLALEKPRCLLKRVELDLADETKRKKFFNEIGLEKKKVLILTEGVIPYLTQEQVSSLAQDLHSQDSFRYWVAEYFDPKVYPYLQASLRTKKMQNAPFQFYPHDWFGFFSKLGWVQKHIRYVGEESVKHGRKIPMPWWALVFTLFASRERLAQSQRMTGYVVYEKK